MKHIQRGLSEDGETIILKKFHGKFISPPYVNAEWLNQNQSLIKWGAGVDVETTGLDFVSQKIVEIAIRPFSYRTDTGEILVVAEGYSGLQDPGEPLTEEVKRITGLTDEILKDQKIDWEQVNQLVESSDLIIAHNAKFDRPFIERSAKSSEGKLWACSLSQVDWGTKGFEIKKLGILAHYHGFFVDAHRAMNDVNAMIYLLGLVDPQTGNTYLQELADNSRRESVLIYADGSPFATKDLLREKGYRWNTERRAWHRTVYEEELEKEIQWLESHVYQGQFKGATHRIPPTENFTSKP